MNLHDSKPTLLQTVASPTSTAGAIVGGTIGAFTAGPIGALAGMVAGAAAFMTVEHVVDLNFRDHDRTRHPSS